MGNFMNTVIEIEQGYFQGWYLYFMYDPVALPKISLSNYHPFLYMRVYHIIKNIFSFLTRGLLF